MTKINEAKILIMATDGFEKSELFQPLEKLTEHGASVTIASAETGQIKSWDKTDWGESVEATVTIDSVDVEEYDALVLPGGQINPDVLRLNKTAIQKIYDFSQAGKIVAAICHAPWLLVEAGVVKDREMTSYPSIKTDLINAGAHWTDQAVVVSNGIITSRKPDDLPAFIAKIVEEVQEGDHQRSAA